MDFNSEYYQLLPKANHTELLKRQQENIKRLTSLKKGIRSLRERADCLPHLKAAHLDFSGDAVTIGKADEISLADRDKLLAALKEFMPWRKGPFSIFGVDIDAEWRSNRKWDRLLPVLPDLKDKVIADVGSNNGYYMFRMQHYNPKLVVGFEPYLHHYFTFRMLNGFAGCSNLELELLGVEDLGLFTESFDVVFLMGILYHRISPVDCLKEIKKAMTPGGTLIVESQAIPGQEPVALFPEGRYAKVPGTYFVPTGTCVKNWMIRAGFSQVEIFCSHEMNSDEQRRTDWMDFESYTDFIDPQNPALTVEGYPAPLRVFLKGIS
ncbi:MAG: tRNA 5-methoxyuridine(34)/uridine 5-oxyacetic acid(34) synthase CmoB [Proteobacteria bacterium]|nr:tRNA 5-methoxyuridine(34)/uridine 5-oxyacetic acid(34) synthase CmoB [Pseudomonadota bacterium]MBU1640762.1 tRNA 5-methoxyuridine(34)/uridine 5-oxyacetic acid(34) synthase CmoB [Pseudomonadota bacterium]